jgi:hypothetical protein
MAAHEHPLTEERRQALQRVYLMLYVQRELPKLEPTASGCWPVSVDRDDEDDCFYVQLFCPDRGPDNGLFVLVSEDGSLMWFNDMKTPNFHLGAHQKYLHRN